MSERRAFPRWPVSVDCHANHHGRDFPGVIKHLSESGLGFESAAVSEVGEQISVAWTLNGGQPDFVVECVVRDHTRAYTGVEFLNLSLGDRLRIVRFLSTQAVAVGVS